MHKTNADFITETKNATVVRVGRSCILQPEIHFSGGTVKWYKDKLKPEPGQCGQPGNVQVQKEGDKP